MQGLLRTSKAEEALVGPGAGCQNLALKRLDIPDASKRVPPTSFSL